ncbi:MAG: glycosyltransferase family 2 protein [Actinomycetales bacterium]|nr:glycosyltransferase family 2 protein [Actinomycetales bacterium]
MRNVIETMPGLVDDIVVVDDRSADNTYREAQEAADARTSVVQHDLNKGVGGSIVSGHRVALERGADIVVVMAGDGQMDPAYLPRLLEPVASGEKGFAKGNRFYSATSYAGMPRHRLIGNVVLTFMTKVASGYWDIVDPQNGYTAISRDALERLPLDRLAERYEFENDQLIWLNILRVPVVDVPIPAVYRDETSTIRLHRVMPRLLRLLVLGFWRRIWLKYILWSFSPIALLLLAGIALTALGAVVGIWAVAMSLGPSSASTGTWLLSLGPLLVGTQFLIQALVLDIQAAP